MVTRSGAEVGVGRPAGDRFRAFGFEQDLGVALGALVGRFGPVRFPAEK